MTVFLVHSFLIHIFSIRSQSRPIFFNILLKVPPNLLLNVNFDFTDYFPVFLSSVHYFVMNVNNFEASLLLANNLSPILEVFVNFNLIRENVILFL